MANVEFIYKGVKTIIQSKLNEKMKIIVNNFINKVKINKDKIYFLCNGKKYTEFNHNLKLEDIMNIEDKKINELHILVYDHESNNTYVNDIIKSKEIICPNCKENTRMNIIDYRINLFECKNGHKIDNILLKEFENTQIINRKNIICDICKINNKSTSYDNTFFRCFKCNKNICPLCKIKHEHETINYDDKNYLCDKHYESYHSYCEQCKKNLCISCEFEHRYHKKAYFGDLLVDKEKLNQIKDVLKNNINMVNNKIKKIINILNDITNNMHIYYKIYEDLIKNYNIKQRNYEILYNLNTIINNNVIEELQNFNNRSNIIDQFNYLFNLYSKMNNQSQNVILINYEDNQSKNQNQGMMKNNQGHYINQGMMFQQQQNQVMMNQGQQKMFNQQQNRQNKRNQQFGNPQNNNWNNMNQNNNQNEQISNINPYINNQNANNQIVIYPNIPRHHYIPKEGMSILPIVEQSSTLLDKKEINEIKNIIQQVYTFSLNPQNGDYMTDIIYRKIKHKLHGEWFIIVSDKNNNIPFSFSTLSKSDYLIITLGNTKFNIVKLK